jgi:hypothetical protein
MEEVRSHFSDGTWPHQYREEVMSMDRHPRRTDLFLVRVWARKAGDAPSGGSAGSGSVANEWSGKVRRVVDGEAHRFEDLQGLVSILLMMLSEHRGE